MSPADADPAAKPLSGLRVLDFSTLLPGPLASLILAEAGAAVTKVERPGDGDAMRGFQPRFGETSAHYAQLNRGKSCLALDLKASDAVARLTPLIEQADILIEQFRPGVMDRLGLGYAAVTAINPRLVYCSITGYGQTGPARNEAGHDLNYLARAGLLAIGGDSTGKPVIPPGLIADIGAGALPAVINILIALRRAETTGQGAHLDMSMTDGLFAWSFWGQAQAELTGATPEPGGELLTGGSPRYQIYATQDQAYIAAAPLEDRFWRLFCDIIDLPETLRGEDADPKAAIKAVQARIGAKPAAHWRAAFAGKDVCANLVQDIAAARADALFQARGLFHDRIAGEDGVGMTAAPMPLSPVFRDAGKETTVPSLTPQDKDSGGAAL